MARKRVQKASPDRPVSLATVASGVPGLDQVLGGGVPKLSFNLLAGGPGSGKTTLAMQLLFANATAARPGLFITILGESALKMLRYQQLFGFFDPVRVGRDVHFLNLNDEALGGHLDDILVRIFAEVERLRPAFLVIDSFRSLMRTLGPDPERAQVDQFVQRLSLRLAVSEITCFLIGEYPAQDLQDPVFTVADGIIWLSQEINRNSVVRRLQVVKARGQAAMPGIHTMRITAGGVQVFPRTPERIQNAYPRSGQRLSTGIAGLDSMMGGGIPSGDSLVLAGPTGSGKTTFAMEFVAAGLARGEPAVIAIFEEHPEAYLERSAVLQMNLREALRAGTLRIIYLRPLDLSVDETLDEIRTAVQAIGAKRVVIDSISGFEMALAPAFRLDFRESLYRLIGALTGLGVTIFSTVEVVEGNVGLQLTGYQVSFLTDDILNQRYVEIEGRLRKVVVVVKMRGSDHSRDFRAYDISGAGVQVHESLQSYDGILSGMPTRQLRQPAPVRPGLTDKEGFVLEALVRAGSSSLTELTRETGVNSTALVPVLARLSQLRYVSRSGSRYHAEAGSASS